MQILHSALSSFLEQIRALVQLLPLPLMAIIAFWPEGKICRYARMQKLHHLSLDAKFTHVMNASFTLLQDANFARV